ncbi:VIT family-domain-containing protein [Melampsora americana]|nr:VIT family-domain-containing protein [Melampsora americana]
MAHSMNQHISTQVLASQDIGNIDYAHNDISPMVEGHLTAYPPFQTDKETSKILDHNNQEEDEDDDKRTLIDPDVLRDIIIGLSDGLTVPFGLTAGLSSLGSSKLVVVAGLAELISGAISMGIGGYLASEAERDQFRYMQRKIRARVARSTPQQMETKVDEIMAPMGIRSDISSAIAYDLLQIESQIELVPTEPHRKGLWKKCTDMLSKRREPYKSILDPEEAENGLSSESGLDDAGMTAFLLKFGEGQEEVPTSRLYISACTIGIAYFLGGLIPMAPYFFVDKARDALGWSVGVMTITLIIFGILKAYFTGAETGVLRLCEGECFDHCGRRCSSSSQLLGSCCFGESLPLLWLAPPCNQEGHA